MNTSLNITADPAIELVTDDDARLVAQLRDRHFTMLWISLVVVVASMVLQPRSTGAVGPAFLPNVNLPDLCSSRSLFGVECPGCGLTRSFLALASGDVAASLAYHRLGWLMALVIVLQFPYRLYCLRELRVKIPTRTWPTWFGYLLLAALLINWLCKVGGVN